MKTIKTSDGQIIHGYEINDLDVDTREKTIYKHGCFLCDIREPDKETAEFPTESEIIDNMKINGYLFNDEGELLPTLYHMNRNNLVKITYGKKQIECTIEQL
jgi:hypothetical protein